MVELGLNSHHQSAVLSYMKFARYLRGQCVKTVDDDFKNSLDSLFDDTFTKDEVIKILDDLKTLIVCDVEGEMCSFTHNNVLMLQQLFTQAETWHLRMEIHLSELQNRELLDMIRMLEDDETNIKPAVEKNPEENTIALLRMEIERLREENQKMHEQQRSCADQLDDYGQQLSTVTEKLKLASTQVQAYRELNDAQKTAESSEQDDGKLTEMAEKLRQVEESLHVDQEMSRERQSRLQDQLNSTKEQVAQVQAQLQLAELELERKFSETKAYANMKQILVKKNEQIKKLRNKIQQIGGENQSDGETSD